MGQNRNKKLLSQAKRTSGKISVISANNFQLTEAANRHSSLQNNLWDLFWDLLETRPRIIGECLETLCENWKYLLPPPSKDEVRGATWV